METDKKVLGGAVDLDVKIEAGIATIEVKADQAGGALSEDLKVSANALVLVSKIFEAVEAKSPPGVVAIEEGAKAIVLAALAKV